jgi:hypothetical protein
VEQYLKNMHNQSNFKNILKISTSWTVLLSLVVFSVFQLSSTNTNAQQANGQIKLSCAPNKEVVQRNENVTFIAKVENATEKVKYSWGGTKIKSVDAPRVTTSYGSLGEKKATVTIVTGTTRVKAECTVLVSTNIAIQTNQNQGQGQDPQSQLQNLLGGTNPFTGGQQGGTNPFTGGQQQGGSNPFTGSGSPTSGSSQTPQLQQSQPQREAAARNQARADAQQREQEIQQNLQEKLQKCETQSNGSKKASEAIQEATTENLEEQATQQQMVPTNPIPIVDPIKDIQANIKRLTAKDIGLESSQEPALDEVTACQTEAYLEAEFKKSENLIYKGDENENGPKFVPNFQKYLRKAKDDAGIAYLEAVMNNKNSCNVQEDVNVVKALIKQSESILKEQAKESCQVASEDKYNLTKLDSYLNFIDPTQNPLIRHLKIEEEWQKNMTSNLVREAYETDIALGFKNIKDDDGNITQPAQVYVNHSLNNFNIATNRLLQLDEATEGQLFKDYTKKIEVGV